MWWIHLVTWVVVPHLMAEEVSSRIQKARMAFTILKQLCRQRDVRLPIKCRVYTTAMRLVLLHGRQTWLLTADLRILSMCEHRCVRDIGRMWWMHFFNYSGWS